MNADTPAPTTPPTDAPSTPTYAPRAALMIVFLVVFIDLLGFGIVLPVMPRQAEPYLAHLGLSSTSKGRSEEHTSELQSLV